MAGGMGRGGVPLHARARAGTGPPPGSEPRESGPAKHCLIRTPVDAGPPRAGLLLEWRKDARGWWEGRVVYAAELRPGEWATVEEWLAADLLSTDQRSAR